MARRKSSVPETEDVGSIRGYDDFDVRLGDIMRGERATMGKSLLDVQRELKIKAAYIAAIENSDVEAFESPGFVAGYVRSYARYLRLDPEWAYKTFCEESGFAYQTPQGLSAQPKATDKKSRGRKQAATQKPAVRDPFAQPSVSYIPTAGARFTGINPGAVGSVVVLFALIGAIGYGGWSVLQEVQKVQFTPVEQTPDVLAQLDPVVPVAEENADATGDSGVTRPSAEAFDRLYRPQALEVPVLTSRDGPIANIEPGSLGAISDQPIRRVGPGLQPVTTTARVEAPRSDAPYAPQLATNIPTDPSEAPAVQVVETGPPEVALFAVRPSWVRVRSSDGTVIFEKILDAGERFVLPQTEEAHTLRAGNAQSLYFVVGDETFGPAGKGASVVSDVVLSATALPEAYTVADADADADLARFTAVAEAQPD